MNNMSQICSATLVRDNQDFQNTEQSVWLTKLYSRPERIIVLDKEDIRATDVQVLYLLSHFTIIVIVDNKHDNHIHLVYEKKFRPAFLIFLYLLLSKTRL